jgi:predicted component of type VI protein secretion system
MVEKLVNFLIKNYNQFTFFKLMQCLESIVKYSQKSQKDTFVINFKIKKYFEFPHSVVKKIRIKESSVIVNINLSIFLTKKRSTALLKENRSKTEQSIVDYFINQFVWVYYNAYKKSHPLLTYNRETLNDPLYSFLENTIGMQPIEAVTLYRNVSRESIRALFYWQYSVEALKYTIKNDFLTDVTIKRYFGRWLRQSSNQYHYLFQKNNKAAIYLNRSFLGSYVFLNMRGFLITIAPLDDDYFEFFPKGRKYILLLKLFKIYLPPNVEIMIILKFNYKILAREGLTSKVKQGFYYLNWTSYLLENFDKRKCKVNNFFKVYLKIYNTIMNNII